MSEDNSRVEDVKSSKQVLQKEQGFRRSIAMKKPSGSISGGPYTGRKPLGNRIRRSVGMEVDIWAKVEAIAEEEGLPATAVVHRIVAEFLGVPVPTYCLPKQAQEEDDLFSGRSVA
ncbi:MAG: hypothetical protein J2P17_15970 [Mycobacterium sp.]|nr:hypothetical protein [Mycobacterium sp.]